MEEVGEMKAASAALSVWMDGIGEEGPGFRVIAMVVAVAV